MFLLWPVPLLSSHAMGPTTITFYEEGEIFPCLSKQTISLDMYLLIIAMGNIMNVIICTWRAQPGPVSTGNATHLSLLGHMWQEACHPRHAGKHLEGTTRILY